MKPRPEFRTVEIKDSGKMTGKTLLITGGDSGIGRAVAVLFAKEGADVAIIYLNEHHDANDTKQIIEQEHQKKCLLISGDISKEKILHFSRE